jgi:hypothetical protein
LLSFSRETAINGIPTPLGSVKYKRKPEHRNTDKLLFPRSNTWNHRSDGIQKINENGPLEKYRENTAPENTSLKYRKLTVSDFTSGLLFRFEPKP